MFVFARMLARGCPDGRRVASRFRWARLLARRRRRGGLRGCPRSMRPALKTGKHKLGAGADARQPSPLAPTRGSSLRSCAGAAKETQRWAGTLLAAAAAAAPTNPPSLSVPRDVSVPSAAPRWVSHAGRAEERAWRQFDMPNFFFLPLFAFILAVLTKCASYSCRVANPNTYARQRVKLSHIRRTRPFFAALLTRIAHCCFLRRLAGTRARTVLH